VAPICRRIIERIDLLAAVLVDVHDEMGGRGGANPVEVGVLGAAHLGDVPDDSSRVDAEAAAADEVRRVADEVAARLAERLGYVGVFALELFVEGGRLLANEMAPRVHNSGHWTIEGAETSQFENHVRAVLGWPLGSTALRSPSAMLNFIGELPASGPVLSQPGAHWHDYGKSARAGRKVGHASFSLRSASDLAAALESAGKKLGRSDQVAPLLAALAKG